MSSTWFRRGSDIAKGSQMSLSDVVDMSTTWLRRGSDIAKGPEMSLSDVVDIV